MENFKEIKGEITQYIDKNLECFSKEESRSLRSLKGSFDHKVFSSSSKSAASPSSDSTAPTLK